ncbi:MAG: hypothetical protein ACXAEU_21615 [Candidatus Hodarchaeales archaeon]|jgi:hypothetical protein
MRKTEIPCKDCNKGFLNWKPSVKRYVCTECGVESEALPIWVSSATHRKTKVEKEKEKRVAFIQEILSASPANKERKKKRKHLNREERLEEEWKDMIDASKDYD